MTKSLKIAGENKDKRAITAKKTENFSEWYSQVIEKADIALTIESIVDGLSWSAVWTPEEHEAGMDYLVIPKGKTILGRLFPEIQYLAGEFSTKLRQNIPKPHTTK